MSSPTAEILSVTTLPLSGRIAVITGASSGIGAATAQRLVSLGAKVALLARRKSKLDALVAEITAAGGTALAIEVDVTSPEQVAAAAATVTAELGRASILINNAGVMLPAPITETRVNDWESMIDLNLTGALRVIGAFTPALTASAQENGVADLVNISSIAAQNVFPSFAVYSATKAAISHLSRHLRAELGPADVRVSMIEPGLVETELASHVTDPAVTDWINGAAQAMTLLKSEDIAETIGFTVALPRHVNLQQVTVMPTHQV
ncbi:SDR family oxidoreductase [Synoicihabitans lomoniglobus]|uniref:SDR family oxidoreductase n=1 Tax=Synoicihabitans lomoniglobus TaxID=2909285 RepID=A0AAF0CN74_9BACT|nr:SDR family oxidoreductase [Opitutaceae bacterium LMO-M01]WED64236.1 SDR family oxidoreductase [Opitutaceae bacterium LMO-M01]